MVISGKETITVIAERPKVDIWGRQYGRDTVIRCVYHSDHLIYPNQVDWTVNFGGEFQYGGFNSEADALSFFG